MTNVRESDPDDEAPCPVCGHGNWRSVPCDHLVADWPDDPYDNGGGILGGGWTDVGAGHTDNAAIAGSGDLATACRDLHNLIVGDQDEARSAARLGALRQVMTQGEQPPWWPWFDEQIEMNDMPEGDDPIALSRFANPVVGAIVETVPDLLLTSPIVGGMTSGSSTFVWSRNRASATAKIKARMASETETIRAITAKLKGDLG